MMRFTSLIALCLLAACGSDDPGAAGNVTPDEARALDEAAEMIETRRVPTEAQQPTASDFAPPSASPAATP
jgi:hypothetical protein